MQYMKYSNVIKKDVLPFMLWAEVVEQELLHQVCEERRQWDQCGLNRGCYGISVETWRVESILPDCAVCSWVGVSVAKQW